MNIECANIKTKVIMLEILLLTISEETPRDLYSYHLKKEGIYDTLDKLEKLDKKYYELCVPQKTDSNLFVTQKIEKNFYK